MKIRFPEPDGIAGQRQFIDADGKLYFRFPTEEELKWEELYGSCCCCCCNDL